MKLDNWNYNGYEFFADLGEEYEISQYDENNWLLVKRINFLGDIEIIWELVFDGSLEDIQEFVEADYLADKKRREIEDKLLMEECYRAMDEFYEQENALKNEWKEKLKGLVNVEDLYSDLSENDSWSPIGIVEVQETDEKRPNYPNHECGRIKGEKTLYMKIECDLTDINHCYVWQQVGMMGDDYSGYLLYPLKGGKYFKVNYSC